MELGLYVITDPTLPGGRSHEDAVRAALRGGARVIQLRDKTLTTRQLIELGRRLKEIVHGHGGIFIVNDRVDVALAVGADGVHIGQEDMQVEDARRLLGRDKIIGVSARTVEAARAAEAAGADYIGTGSIASTSSKPDAVVIGFEGLRRICDAVRIPVVAIGGITLQMVEEIIKAGASGIAVISAVMGAQDIEAAAREFSTRIERAFAEFGPLKMPQKLQASYGIPGGPSCRSGWQHRQDEAQTGEKGEDSPLPWIPRGGEVTSQPSQREYPAEPRVAASALVLDQEGRVLLVRRGNEPNYGLWSLPGGMVEPGERARDAAMRELEEECGIRAIPGSVVDVVDAIVRDQYGRIRYHYVIAVFRGQPRSTELSPSSEVLEAKWIPPVQALALPLTDTTREVLNKIMGPSPSV